MLLIDDREREPRHIDAILDQGVRADHDVDLANARRLEDLAPIDRPCRTGEQPHPRSIPIRQSGIEHAQSLQMLLGKDLGRRHEGGLETIRCRSEHRRSGHRGLAGADVSLEQPGHWLLLAHVFENLSQHRLLRSREPERQRG